VITYKVHLSCGHFFECAEEDAHGTDLFIGKSVQCVDCDADAARDRAASKPNKVD
jgi:hypothetical protein